jgi:segregation and condensation protein B
VLLEANGQFQLATHSQNSDMVKNFLNADLREKLTEATVEVLAIIAYRQPIAKSEIEAIRAHNCLLCVPIK